MEEKIKKNISNNLILLRKNRKLTQQDLANEMNYSDKAVSRWELGESMPDINMLEKLCDFYGVEFEWLIHEHEEAPKKKGKADDNIKITIAVLLAVCCFALATVIYVYNYIVSNKSLWLVFVGALPVSVLIVNFFAKKWWKKLISLVLLSIALWSIITFFYLYFLPKGNMWPLFLLGVPAQIIIFLLHILRRDI